MRASNTESKNRAGLVGGLEGGARGRIYGVSLVDLLQMLKMGNHSCAVRVYDRDRFIGTIYFEKGLMCHAETEDGTGQEALATILENEA